MRPTVRSIAAVDGRPDAAWAEHATDLPMVVYECRRCAREVTCSLDPALLEQPAVISFSHDHDRDIQAQPPWAVVRLDPERASIEDDAPFRATATYELAGKALTVTVDETLTVVDVRS